MPFFVGIFQMTIFSFAEKAMASLPISLEEVNGGILAAVSGGSDSMALAMLLKEWTSEHGVPFMAAVCDHGLRAESADEADMVAERLSDMGIQNTVLKLKISPDGGGIQERARYARHAALQNFARRKGLGVIAFGHHLMDQVETVAQRMEGGTDTVRGRAGILPVRVMGDMLYIRPLLQFGKGELRDLLREEGIRWVEDPSNQNEAFTRVRIRNSLKKNPSMVEDFIQISHEAQKLLFASQILGDEILNRSTVLEWPGGATWLDTSYYDNSLAAEEAAITLIQKVSGKPFPHHPKRILEALRKGGTIGGMQVSSHPEGGVMVFREAMKMEPATVDARYLTAWDGRIRLAQDVPKAFLGPIGPHGATALKREAWAKEIPHIVLKTVPCLRNKETNKGISIPQAGWGAPIEIKTVLRRTPVFKNFEHRSLTFGM